MLLKSWIGVCTVFVAAGWLLSAAGQLNVVSYVITACAAMFVLILVLCRSRVQWKFRLRRFQRPLPLTFALIWVVAGLGGVLHAPNNYDALSYRLPRLLAWFANGHWSWIETTNLRMNYSAANVEWLSAPLVALSHSDRLLFLLNLISYSFLPSLIFSGFRQLGVRNRVAWAWMWVLPAAFCFALQAASIGNDLIGVVFVLASLHFSLGALRTQKTSDAWLAMLALALATGTKGSNLPLVLPGLVALWPVRSLFSRRPIASGAVLAVTLLVSYLPTGILNHRFTGDWRGDPRNLDGLQVRSPIAGILGNSLELAVQNFQPPLVPAAGILEQRLVERIPMRLRTFLRRDFPRFAPQLGELPREETTGLGLPLIVLLSVAFSARFLAGRMPETTVPRRYRSVPLVPWATCAAVLTYLALVGSEAPARLLSPYYLLLLPPLAAGSVNDKWVRKTWWRASSLVAMLSTVLVLVLTPARPLWPAQAVLTSLQSLWPESRQLARAQQVYSVYRERNDLLRDLRDRLPRSAIRIGVIDDDNDIDYALWRPFGVRKVSYLAGTHSWEQETQGFTWIVGKTSVLTRRFRATLDQPRLSPWYLVAAKQITSLESRGPEQWFVLRIGAHSDPQAANAQDPPK